MCFNVYWYHSVVCVVCDETEKTPLSIELLLSSNPLYSSANYCIEETYLNSGKKSSLKSAFLEGIYFT